jgi:DAACS family dicarboxylate/amino acid:cation (Na+ or H+) symporter
MRLSRHSLLLGGFLVGALGGLAARQFLGADSAGLANFVAYVTQPIGKIFLRLLFMLVIPLLFSALTMGIAGLDDLKKLGRVGFRTLVYTVCVSTIAVLIGLGLVNLLKPGEGLDPAVRDRLVQQAASSAAPVASSQAPTKGIDLLVQMVPDNPVKAAANGDMLGVMFFALMFGIGLLLTQTPSARKLEGAIDGLYDVSMRLIDLVIRIAPLGVAALLFNLTSTLGVEILGTLAKYVGVVVLALAIHQFGVYSLAVSLFGGMSPLRFFRGIQEAMLTAFSTASSNATLPTALKVAAEKLHLPKDVSRFVLTVGSTANQNGTALFEGVTVLFLAQFYGVHLSLAEQTTVLLIAVLGGIGTAGVPAGSIPVVAMILTLVGVPAEGIGLILGVDRFLDMCRTTLNVTGDLAAAVVVSRFEGTPEPEVAA